MRLSRRVEALERRRPAICPVCRGANFVIHWCFHGRPSPAPAPPPPCPTCGEPGFVAPVGVRPGSRMWVDRPELAEMCRRDTGLDPRRPLPEAAGASGTADPDAEGSGP